MRRDLAALAMALTLGLAPAVTTAAAPARQAAKAADWQAMVVATPEGGFRIGNPAAPVKLIEYGSLTCPHCAHFHETAMAAIRSNYVASGKVSFEFRNFILNAPDYAAALLARCRGPKPFFATTAALYANQTKWLEPFAKVSDADQTRLQATPPDKQIAALAEIGKLDAFVAPLGIDRAKFDACLADKPAIDKLLAMRKDAVDTWKLTGTPGFILNGKTQAGVYSWEALEPLLKAALG